MSFLHNHSRTIVNEATQSSSRNQIQAEHGFLPFEGEGFVQNWHRDYASITWTEIRPIYRLTRKGELKLLGGIRYYVDKFAEIPEQGVWHPAHYHCRGLMTASGYREALKKHNEEMANEEKRLSQLNKTSVNQR